MTQTATKEKRRYGKKLEDQKSEKLTVWLTPHSKSVLREVVSEELGDISLSEMMEQIARGNLKLIRNS